MIRKLDLTSFNVKLILICCLFPCKVMCSDTLTVSQAFNFNIGDTFDYKNTWVYEADGGGGWTYITYYRIVIADKYFSQNGDTMFIRETVTASVETESGSFIYTNSNFTVTRAIDSLNSPIIRNLDSTQIHWDYCNFYYMTDTAYHDRVLNGYSWVSGYYDVHQRASYVAGLGLTDFEYAQSDGIGGEIKDTTLVYYSKSGEIWGTPYYILTAVPEVSAPNNSIQLYPNPASNFCYLHVNNNNEVCTALILDVDGRVVKNVVNDQHDSKLKFDLSNLSAGLYFVQIKSPFGSTITSKLVKE